VGAKNAKNGSEAEPKEVEHGGKVIADQILILLISKADRIMTRHKAENLHQMTMATIAGTAKASRATGASSLME
jgi:hypothetical protein